MLSQVIDQLKELQEEFCDFQGETKEKIIYLEKELKIAQDNNLFYTEPNHVAYLMKHGSPAQQEWGNSLELELQN